jgi:hypothetical protein
MNMAKMAQVVGRICIICISMEVQMIYVHDIIKFAQSKFNYMQSICNTKKWRKR